MLSLFPNGRVDGAVCVREGDYRSHTLHFVFAEGLRAASAKLMVWAAGAEKPTVYDTAKKYDHADVLKIPGASTAAYFNIVEAGNLPEVDLYCFAYDPSSGYAYLDEDTGEVGIALKPVYKYGTMDLYLDGVQQDGVTVGVYKRIEVKIPLGGLRILRLSNVGEAFDANSVIIALSAYDATGQT